MGICCRFVKSMHSPSRLKIRFDNNYFLTFGYSQGQPWEVNQDRQHVLTAGNAVGKAVLTFFCCGCQSG